MLPDSRTMQVCQGPLWDGSFWTSDRLPVFTPCLENVLGTLPALYMAVGGIGHLCLQRGRPSRALPSTALHLARLAVTVVLMLLRLCGVWFLPKDAGRLFDVVCEVSRVLSFAMAFAVQRADRRKGVSISAFLTGFWLLELICELPPFYRHLLTAFGNEPLETPPGTPGLIWFGRAGLVWAAYSLLLLQFVLAAVSEDLDGVPRQTSPVSKMLLCFFTDLVLLGCRKALTLKDLPPLPDHMTAEECYGRWRRTARRHALSGRRATLLRSMLAAYWPDIAKAWLMSMCFVTTRVCSFLALSELVSFLAEPEQPAWKGCAFALMIFSVYVISSTMIRWADYFAVGLGLKFKALLISAIMRKAFTISGSELGRYTVGEMVNLLSVDADKVNQFSFYVGIMIGCPFYILLCSILLWRFLGPACLAGISVILVMMPLTGTVAAKSRTVQSEQMRLKDSRLKRTSEMLSSMKIIKFYGWELPFVGRVQEIRFEEHTLLKKLAFLTATLRFFWSITPFLVSLFAFVAYLFVNDFTMIDANTAFVSLGLFNSMRFSLAIVPDVISNGVQTLVSLRRIEEFLNCDDMQKNRIGSRPEGDSAVSWKGATLSWNGREDVLHEVDLAVKPGEFVAVVGKVGCGKSSLLASLLGDLALKKGRMDSRGSLAYVPQQASIQNATIKDNILFTAKLDSRRYRDVLEKCCLTADLKVLPGGDQTEIGEKGVNLSGGQKQRISLARAVYQDRDIFLLDDPLHAVDVHVGSAIFRNVIANTGILRSKTRILVTNMLSVLPHVDRVVVLKNGRIAKQGTYEHLKSSSKEFADFLKEHANEEKQEHQEAKEKPRADLETPFELESTTSAESSRGPAEKLILDEVMQAGSVKFFVYSRYFSKVGLPLCLTIVVGFAGARTFDALSGIWLGQWSKDESGHEDRHYAMRTTRILVYAALGLLYGSLSYVGTAALANATITASRKLHNVILNSVIRAPMSFFDTTPLGRLLNRFGKDIDQLDIQLPVVANLFLEMFFQLLGVIVLISVNAPVFLLVASPLFVVYYLLQRIYMATIRQVKRMESVTRSPLYNHFSGSLDCLSSIRAYGATAHFVGESNKRLDTTQNCSYLLFLGKMWLGTRLDIVANFIVLLSNILIVLQRDVVDPGVAGFIVSYSMGASFAFNFIVHYASEVEAAIVASERLEEYSDIAPEAPWTTEAKPSDDWPSAGAVTFQSYAARYREGLTLVLRDVNLRIASGEKVGIVGRTGAGKSSLTLSLFRIIEAASGKLLIDGVDVSQLGLHDLRPRLTIIPQDPVIFSGSLRLNLDPNSAHTDEQLWDALERAHVKQHFEAKGLETDVAEGGNNLSLGQRQLLCLARAILQKKRILIMDEATTAVDVETDALIQNTIRTDFSECTILTIAHRLNTIMDSDRVVVIDMGTIVEQGSPQQLLADATSRFYGMAKEAGFIRKSVVTE